jgi:hypothetical protein
MSSTNSELNSTTLDSPSESQRPKLKVAKVLTLPLLSIAHSLILTVQITGELFKSDIEIKAINSKDPYPTVAPCINMDNGEKSLLIANAIIVSTLGKIEGGYVGKYFRLEAGNIREGKTYRDVRMTLMEEDT